LMPSFAHKMKLLILPVVAILAGITPSSGAQPMPEGCEEIVVSFEVPRLLQQDIYAIYGNTILFLSVSEIFGHLDLNIEAEIPGQRWSGLYIDRNRPYSIDLRRKEARVDGKGYTLTDADFKVYDDELYLSIEALSRLFGFEMKFYFSSLLVRLTLDTDFPSYQKMKRRQEHQKLKSKRAAAKSVRHLPGQTQYFGGGVADWAVSGSPLGDGGQYYSMAVGAMLMGGDLELSGSGNSNLGFDRHGMMYRWHYSFGQNNLISQGNLGHLPSTGFLSRRLIGVSATNQPQVQRKVYQRTTIEGEIGEGWEVEIYVGSRLADFQLTDMTGRYSFDVDINYGTTEILLKMYGPNGEIQTERRYVGVTYNQIPEGTFEYSVSAGRTDPVMGEGRNYVQASGFYGATSGLTVGGSGDFPTSSPEGERPTVAAEATWQIMGDLATDVSFAPGYATEGAISFNRPSLFSAHGSFTKYFENEFRNPARQEYAARLSLNSPLKIGARYYGLRFSSILNKFQSFSTINLSYGTSLQLLRTHLTYLGRTSIKKSGTTTDSRIISEVYVMPRFLPIFQPLLKVTYDHSLNRLTRYGIQYNRRIFKLLQANVAVDRNAVTGSYQVIATLRLPTGFADFSSRVVSTGDHIAVSQIQRGSIRYDQMGKRVRLDRRNGIGLSSALIRPFADENYNGRRDRDERFLGGVKANIKGGRPRQSGPLKQYYYDGLLAYDKHLIQIDEFGLDDPMLKPTHDNYGVVCPPNVVTAIDIPIVMVTEINGHVERLVGKDIAGVGGIKVFAVNDATDAVVEVTSFSSGEYFYLGLVPGNYHLYVDPSTLEKLGLRSEPPQIELEVKPSNGGEVIGFLDFELLPR